MQRDEIGGALSHHPPFPPQQPFRAAQQQDQEKEDRHIPKLLRFANRDSGFRDGYFVRQTGKVLRTPIAPARLRGKLLQQVAILSGMKILGGSVDPLIGQDVAPQLLVSALRHNFGEIGAGLRGGPIGLKDAGIVRRRVSSRPSPRFHWGQGCALPRAHRWPAGIALSRTSAEIVVRPSSKRTWLGTEAETLPGVPFTSQRSNCRQNISCEVSPKGMLICQRQVPEVASTAERPRPKFCVISRGNFRPPAFMSASTSGSRLGFAGVLVVHQVGQFLPLLDILGGVIHQARDQAVPACRVQLRRGAIAVEGARSGQAEPQASHPRPESPPSRHRRVRNGRPA